MTHICLDNVTVRYPIYATTRQRSIFGFAVNKASFGRIARDAGNIPVVTALNGVSLDLREGDRLALIGRNGSGKTTLLKLCARLLFPDSGIASIEGTCATILNITAGMDADKTGLENIEMMGRLLGVPRSDRNTLIEDIAEFTELGEFLTLPVRIYSAGMAMRLVFALATSIEREILVVDEVIGAGDTVFVARAAERLKRMFDRAKILVLATHSGEIARQLCTRAVWIDRGRFLLAGDPQAVWDAYDNQRHQQATAHDPESFEAIERV
jgi:ABC-type polysaccharide/polyol phosphate transport system ATPase subunit